MSRSGAGSPSHAGSATSRRYVVSSFKRAALCPTALPSAARMIAAPCCCIAAAGFIAMRRPADWMVRESFRGCFMLPGGGEGGNGKGHCAIATVACVRVTDCLLAVSLAIVRASRDRPPVLGQFHASASSRFQEGVAFLLAVPGAVFGAGTQSTLADSDEVEQHEIARLP